MQNEFQATSQDQILCNFHTEAPETTQQDGSFSLFGNSFNSHGSDVSAPSIFNSVICHVDLFGLLVLFIFIFFFPLDINHFNFILLLFVGNLVG